MGTGLRRPDHVLDRAAHRVEVPDGDGDVIENTSDVRLHGPGSFLREDPVELEVLNRLTAICTPRHSDLDQSPFVAPGRSDDGVKVTDDTCTRPDDNGRDGVHEERPVVGHDLHDRSRCRVSAALGVRIEHADRSTSRLTRVDEVQQVCDLGEQLLDRKIGNLGVGETLEVHTRERLEHHPALLR